MAYLYKQLTSSLSNMKPYYTSQQRDLKITEDLKLEHSQKAIPVTMEDMKISSTSTSVFNVNQHYNEVSPETGQNGYHQRSIINSGEGVEKRTLLTLIEQEYRPY